MPYAYAKPQDILVGFPLLEFPKRSSWNDVMFFHQVAHSADGNDGHKVSALLQWNVRLSLHDLEWSKPEQNNNHQETYWWPILGVSIISSIHDARDTVIYKGVSQNEAAVCFVVCFGGLFRTVLLPRTVKFKGSVSGSVSKVCFGVCFGGLFRQSRTSQPYLKLHPPKKCKPINTIYVLDIGFTLRFVCTSLCILHLSYRMITVCHFFHDNPVFDIRFCQGLDLVLLACLFNIRYLWVLSLISLLQPLSKRRSCNLVHWKSTVDGHIQF